MKRNRKSVIPYDPLVVTAPERLCDLQDSWTVKPSLTQGTAETDPLLLPVGVRLDLDRLVADSLTGPDAVQTVVFAAIDFGLRELADDLEGAEDTIGYGLFHMFEPLFAYEEGIRITVKVVFSRDLPYECPQDHSAIRSDMCCDCGVTVSTLRESLLHLDETIPLPVVDDAETGPVDDGPEQGIHVVRLVEGSPLNPVLPPLTGEAIED